MPTMTREELGERLQQLKREPHLRCSMKRFGAYFEPDSFQTAVEALSIYEPLFDAYLRVFLFPNADGNPCPCCGSTYGFSWGLQHGAGSCSCGWPATLYHYIKDIRDDSAIVCAEAVNGGRDFKCERPRGEHVPTEVTWHTSDGETVETELRCPGSPAAGFVRRFRPPDIVRFNKLLWLHPYAVHLTPKKKVK